MKVENHIKPIKLFYSYSHRDEAFQEELKKHLSILKRQGYIQEWYDRRITAGSEWRDEIDQNLTSSEIILLLVSADFLASDYCYNIEMKRAIERHLKGESIVIPIIIRPCDWMSTPFSSLQALPKDSKPLTTWQLQDEAFLSIVEGIKKAITNFSNKHQNSKDFSKKPSNLISVEFGEATNYPCDVLVLKYAQANYGVDKIISGILRKSIVRKELIQPEPWNCSIVNTEGIFNANRTLFVGVPPLSYFGYEEIYRFAKEAILCINTNTSEKCVVAMTIHGVGYGLDERESFLSQIRGILDGLNEVGIKHIQKICIIDIDRGRVIRLGQLLSELLAGQLTQSDNSIDSNGAIHELSEQDSKQKEHVFVAMPFSEEMEDVYAFGIQNPVNKLGYLCERVDLSTFTGDILERIKSKIETAKIVIADVSGANPNVYLEVGYSWGKRKPTLLIARKGEDLRFDLKNQKCLLYKNISNLASQLESDLPLLLEENHW